MLYQSNLIRVITVVLCLAAPAVTIHILSDIYNAPYLKPLALTEESVAAAGARSEGETHVTINVLVGWGSDWEGSTTQESFRQILAKTLEPQTKLYYIEFEEMPGQNIDVTFFVGHNSYGPFPPDQMVSGIQSALIALRMTNGPERR